MIQESSLKKELIYSDKQLVRGLSISQDDPFANIFMKKNDLTVKVDKYFPDFDGSQESATYADPK